MRIATSILIAVALWQTPQTPAPVFRSGVDLIRLDVSVFDKDRQPVRGLAQADFTVLEDGKPQTVAAFSYVELPERVVETGTAEWTRTVDRDVATNDLAGHRLIAIVIDDAEFPSAPKTPPSPVTMKNAKQIARDIVTRMGPNDLATVIFTRDNRNTQDFTASRSKLIASIEKATFGFNDEPYYSGSMLRTVGNIAQFLIEAPEQRKVLVFISGGMPYDLDSGAAPSQGSARGSQSGVEAVRALRPWRDRLFAEAQKANVNVYSYDVCGLRPAPAPGTGGIPDPCQLDAKGKVSLEWLQTVADNTGGHATINTSDFQPGITQMFRENDSYYLVAYKSQRSGDDGSLRRIAVKVNRPGVTVRTRSLYEAPSAKAAAKNADAPADVKALADILPKADLTMRLAAAPMAVPGKSVSTVALAVGFQQPVQTDRFADEVDLLVKAFTPEGKEVASVPQKVTIAVPAARRGSEFTRYETLARLDLKPGRYELRVSSHSNAFDTRGSVYADIDVPDFTKAPVSLSGVVLSAAPGLPVAPADALSALVPVTPTASREFSRIDRVSAFLRLYQGGKDKLSAATVHVTIVDATGVMQFEQTDALGVEQFSKDRAADALVALPLTRLVPGEYLLSFEAVAGAATAKRELRFTVR